jgi:plastocyanin
VLTLWLAGIGGGFLIAGHEPRVNNFLTASTPAAGGGGAQVSGSAKAGAGGSSLVMKMKDFSYDPNKVTAPAGKITFTLQNYGRYTHDFRIKLPDGSTLESGRIGAGFSHDFAVTLKPGTYEFDCSVSNHAKRGMKGTLVVS